MKVAGHAPKAWGVMASFNGEEAGIKKEGGGGGEGGEEGGKEEGGEGARK